MNVHLSPDCIENYHRVCHGSYFDKTVGTRYRCDCPCHSLGWLGRWWLRITR